MCWEGRGVSELENLKQCVLDAGCKLKEVKPSLPNCGCLPQNKQHTNAKSSGDILKVIFESRCK